MSGCSRTFCSACGQELIHRDNRKPWESASALGQIVSRDAPRTFTCGDVDLYVRKAYGGATLLRWLEHKQPTQEIRPPQARALRDFDALVEHALDCPSSPLKLTDTSGVWLVRGKLDAATDGRRATYFDGPQRVWNRRHGWHELETPEAFFDWLAPKRAA